MTTPATTIATQLIAQCEGFGFGGAPYQDTAGVWSQGYGSTRLPDGSHILPTSPQITIETAREWLARDLALTAAAVDAMVPDTTTDCQRAALYSFAYNVGVNALRGSTLLHLFRAGDVQGAADQFAAWVYSGGHVTPGLVNRRKLERGVFLGTVRFDVPPAETTDDLNAAELQQIEQEQI